MQFCWSFVCTAKKWINFPVCTAVRTNYKPSTQARRSHRPSQGSLCAVCCQCPWGRWWRWSCHFFIGIHGRTQLQVGRLGREGKKLGQNDFQFGRFAGGTSWKGELRWFVMETWSCFWHECHYSCGADNDTADWNGDAVMLHAKRLLYDIWCMYQYVSICIICGYN